MSGNVFSLTDAEFESYYGDGGVKWVERMLALAKHVAQWSKDPSTKVGAVLTDDQHRILGVGYNGFPRGVEDDLALYEDRTEKYARVVHAEMNAILNSHGSLEGATLYTWPFMPCDRCATFVIQAGIKHVMSLDTSEEAGQRWSESFDRAWDLFTEAGVKVTLWEEN